MLRGPRNPGKALAVLLAVAVHVALALFLIFGVRWQNQHPETMMVELVAPPPPVRLPPPKIDPKPEPKVEPRPEPKADPKPEPKPEPPPPKAEPKAEPPPTPKADIALKQKQEKDRLVREKLERELQEMQEKQDKVRRDQDRLVREQREMREREMRDMAKKESDRREREMKELVKRETDKRALDEAKLAQERAQAEADARKRRDEQLRVEREQREQRERTAATDAAAKSAASKSVADYVNKIQAKIKGNVILPPDVSGNPEAIFEVVQLPTGEIISADLRKSSGLRIYDEAVSRAIAKSSPLPKPDSPDQFQRSLTLRFRPQS